jgi:hypothetical protein
MTASEAIAISLAVAVLEAASTIRTSIRSQAERPRVGRRFDFRILGARFVHLASNKFAFSSF